jgi:hypothetical protein
MNFFQTAHLLHFSKPEENRFVYRKVKQHRPHRIVEVGLQKGLRTLNLLKLAVSVCENPLALRYFCVDPFEGRTKKDGPGLSLRKAYRAMNQMEIQHKLIPATPLMGIKRIANHVQNVDFLVLATPELHWLEEGGWYYLARMLHQESVVLLGERQKRHTPYRFREIPLREREDFAIRAEKQLRLSKAA